jgi:very-short-patch-repair endonuclease
MLRLERYTAVSVMDSALNRGLIAEADLPRVSRLITGRRGAVNARPWLAEADPRAESPLETRVRLRCVDGKVAPDILQHKVYNRRGDLLGIGDLAWLQARVLAEADGAEVHSQPRAVFRDRRRQNELANAGWTIVRFTWQDTLKPGYIAHVVRNALARAAA